MTFCSEILLMLPCHDLGDLTSRSREGAQSLLTAWTAAWHPQILETLGKLPQWYAADAAPEPEPGRLALIPLESAPLLSSGWQTRIALAQANGAVHESDALSIGATASRKEIAEKIVSGTLRKSKWDGDFYALAMNLLQIQRATRRLRYSSNLDDAYFAEQVILAAKAVASGEDSAVQSALQNCFDLLAQERDHYFAGDPYLIDLTLVAAGQSPKDLAVAAESADPTNWLLSADVISQLSTETPRESSSPTAEGQIQKNFLEKVRERLQGKTDDFAGGWFDTESAPNLLTSAECEQQLQRAAEVYSRNLGRSPRVFARLTGGLPPDFLTSLVRRGFTGAIAADFMGGHDSGQREPKLVWQSGAESLDAITCAPLDAGNPLDILDVGTQLAEAMDAGNVPTALLTHWAGQSCDAYDDLKRAASWGLSLGRFVTLHEYFENSARSYHTFKPNTSRADWNWLASSDSSGPAATADPVLRERDRFVTQVQAEVAEMTDNLLLWALGDQPATATPASASGRANLTMVFNPHAAKLRTSIETSSIGKHAGVLATAKQANKNMLVRLEVPACGFATLAPGKSGAAPWWSRQKKLSASPATLHNEFMSVEIATNLGSVQSVHSAGMRGNRFSLRLCSHDRKDAAHPYSEMRATSVKIRHSDAVRGEVSVVGQCVRNNVVEANFDLVYRLDRGSRILEVEGEVEPLFDRAADPANRYLAFRAAVHDPSVLPELMCRDRRITASGRRYTAPLGLHLDMASHSVTVCAAGFAAHRRSEDAVFDTLVVTGRGKRRIKLAYGFDLGSPIHAARSLIAPPLTFPREKFPSTGYFLHIAPSSVVIAQAIASLVSPGVLELTLVETEGKSRQVKLTSALPLKSATLQGKQRGESKSLEIVDDSVSVSLSEHGSASVTLTR